MMVTLSRTLGEPRVSSSSHATTPTRYSLPEEAEFAGYAWTFEEVILMLALP
jgi:hypothetical protein